MSYDRTARSAKEPLHILLVPSEEFLPQESHLAGIFQLHQAKALASAGCRVGAISVRLVFSIPMILRAALYRAVGRRPGNALDGKSIGFLMRLLFQKVSKPELFLSAEEVDGIPVVRIEGFYYVTPSARTDYFGWRLAGRVAFQDYCTRHGRPDLIHAHNLYPAGLLAEKLSHEFGIPFVVTEHSSFLARDLLPKSLYSSLLSAANRAGRLVAVSHSLGEDLQRTLGVPAAQIEWIPNLVDPAFLKRADQPASKNTFTFLSIGNLIELKNHALLIRAYGQAFSRETGVELRIGGDGPLADDLVRLVDDLGLEARVKFLGRLERDQVARELDACDCVVLPSRYETFGVILIESLARGKPVIATRCGGPQSIVENGDGIMVEPDDLEALAQALETMRLTNSTYDQEEIRERALARFGPERVGSELLNLYERVIAKARCLS